MLISQNITAYSRLLDIWILRLHRTSSLIYTSVFQTRTYTFITDSWFFTVKNPLISPNFLVWKFCGKAQFPHSFHTRKLGEVTGFLGVFPFRFYVVQTFKQFQCYKKKHTQYTINLILYFRIFGTGKTLGLFHC